MSPTNLDVVLEVRVASGPLVAVNVDVVTVGQLASPHDAVIVTAHVATGELVRLTKLALRHELLLPAAIVPLPCGAQRAAYHAHVCV